MLLLSILKLAGFEVKEYRSYKISKGLKQIEVKNSSKNTKLASYLTENNIPIYYK